MKKILVIAAHPMDETLGVGGTILKHAANGDELHWLILTKPEESKWDKEKVEKNIKEVSKVAQMYKFKSFRRLNFLQDSLDESSLKELVEVIKGTFELIKPNIIYFPFGNTLDNDYSIAFRASLKAIESFKTKIQKILCYEVVSCPDFVSEIFNPNLYVDVSEFIDNKLEIMNLYEEEVQGYPMPKSTESIRSLAKVRGAAIATEYAEAFVLIKEIC
ncbi:MAG: PIG-L family deacetylase [Candidatus Gastranaerophilales bacterium]|nr:PIG-L family deacetylase [Candidatus Gastranaerophilales bacterium]